MYMLTVQGIFVSTMKMANIGDLRDHANVIGEGRMYNGNF